VNPITLANPRAGSVLCFHLIKYRKPSGAGLWLAFGEERKSGRGGE
jgi:hypothetical protein